MSETRGEQRGRRRAHAVDERGDAHVAAEDEGQEPRVQRRAGEAHLARGSPERRARDEHVAIAKGAPEQLDAPAHADAAVLGERDLGGGLVREGDAAEEARRVRDEQDARDREERGRDGASRRGRHLAERAARTGPRAAGTRCGKGTDDAREPAAQDVEDGGPEAGRVGPERLVDETQRVERRVDRQPEQVVRREHLFRRGPWGGGPRGHAPQAPARAPARRRSLGPRSRTSRALPKGVAASSRVSVRSVARSTTRLDGRPDRRPSAALVISACASAPRSAMRACCESASYARTSPSAPISP